MTTVEELETGVVTMAEVVVVVLDAIEMTGMEVVVVAGLVEPVGY